MITFADCKTSSIVDIAGTCADSPKFASLINDATRRLLRRGDFVGTNDPIHICVRQGCLVMPRYVQSVRKLSVCNQPLPVGNLWYRFLNASECAGSLGTAWNHSWMSPGVLHHNGTRPCYADIQGDGRFVRAYPTTVEDIGKNITIFGIDNGNQPLRTNNGDGTWSDGWVIPLIIPFGSTSDYVRRIDRVVKDETQGPVRLYAYHAANNILEDLAYYEAGETSPNYTRYSLHLNVGTSTGVCTGGSTCCSSVISIVALVKYRFIPVRYDNDWVMIQNIDALKDQVQAIKLREEGDLQAAIQFELSAVRELNRELEDHFPDDTFSAANNIFGGASFTNQCF